MYGTLNSWMWHYHLLYRSIVLSQEVQVSGCMHVYRQFSAAQLQRHSCYKANNARLKRCRSKFTLLLPVSPSKRCICRCNMLIWVSSKSNLENYMQKCAHTNTMCLLPNTKRCTSTNDSFNIISFSHANWCWTAFCIRTNSRSAWKLPLQLSYAYKMSAIW